MTENKNTEAADSVNHETAHTSATPDRDQDQTESRDDEVIRSALKQLTPERIRSLISDKKVIQIAARLVSSTKTVHFRGPQPPPEMLQGYEDVQKGFAERLLSMAEREAAHRHTIETRLIEDDATKVKRGQWFGLVISVGGITGGVILGWLGFSWQGVAAICGTMGTLAATFILGRRQQQSDTLSREETAPHLESPSER